MSQDQRNSLFRPEALGFYQRPIEADTPELLLRWRGWCPWLAGALIVAAAVVWRLW
jgi:hypothetical protein